MELTLSLICKILPYTVKIKADIKLSTLHLENMPTKIVIILPLCSLNWNN